MWLMGLSWIGMKWACDSDAGLVDVKGLFLGGKKGGAIRLSGEGPHAQPCR